MNRTGFRSQCNEICQSYLTRQNCESTCSSLDTAQIWLKEIPPKMKWVFDITGKHLGAPGQVILVVLVAAVAYNVLNRTYHYFDRDRKRL